MRKLTWPLVAGCGTLVVVLGVFRGPVRRGEERAAKFVRDLDAWLGENRKELDRYAAAVMAVEVRKKRSSLTYEPPVLAQGGFDVKCATVDANTNVYLVLNDSHATCNIGLIKRRGAAALLGDGLEPQIVYTNHLRDDWWYYKTR